MGLWYVIAPIVHKKFMMADFMNMGVSATMLYCVFYNWYNMSNIILPWKGFHHARLITLIWINIVCVCVCVCGVCVCVCVSIYIYIYIYIYGVCGFYKYFSQWIFFFFLIMF